MGKDTDIKKELDEFVRGEEVSTSPIQITINFNTLKQKHTKAFYCFIGLLIIVVLLLSTFALLNIIVATKSIKGQIQIKSYSIEKNIP